MNTSSEHTRSSAVSFIQKEIAYPYRSKCMEASVEVWVDSSVKSDEMTEGVEYRSLDADTRESARQWQPFT